MMTDPRIIQDDTIFNGPVADRRDWVAWEWLILVSGIALIFALYVIATGSLPL